ncbi:MAG: clan AA aspartic protease, partial [Verrucomicrobiae bacterium]|nr:clan AA aspartic protease [Verrucomicrobiae bacterium]
MVSTGFLGAGISTADVKIDYRDGLIWIPVTIEGQPKPLSFLLDSGAEQSVIDLRLAEKLGFALAGQETVLRVDGPARSYTTEKLSLSIDTQRWAGALLAMDLSSASRNVRGRIDGLIGMDFLRSRCVT